MNAHPTIVRRNRKCRRAGHIKLCQKGIYVTNEDRVWYVALHNQYVTGIFTFYQYTGIPGIYFTFYNPGYLKFTPVCAGGGVYR